VLKELPSLERHQDPVSYETRVPDNAHIAFGIVFLGTLLMLGGGIIWLVLR
jgi:hypothetical protein